MVKKFKDISEGQFSQNVKESTQQIWLAGLGAYNKAQKEGTKVFDALVKHGEAIQKKTRKIADEKLAAVASTTTGKWDRLEEVFEERVSRVMATLGVPTKNDIDKLSKRVAELTAVVQKLADTRNGVAAKPVKAAAVKPAVAPKPAVAKPVAAKAAAKPAAAKPATAKKPAPAKTTA